VEEALQKSGRVEQWFWGKCYISYSDRIPIYLFMSMLRILKFGQMPFEACILSTQSEL